jgi:hypothetical protein
LASVELDMDTKDPGDEKREPGRPSEEPSTAAPKRDEQRERREHEEFMRRWIQGGDPDR